MVAGLQLKNVLIKENSVIYKDKFYGFEEIKHIFFQRTLTTHRMNFAKVGEAGSAQLSLILHNASKINIKIDESIGIGPVKLVGSIRNKKDDLRTIFDQ